MPWPTEWQALFGRSAPLLLEIGFGGGHFLVHLAQSRPEANVVGVEISLPSLRRGERKLSRAGMTNALLVQGGATFVLWALCSPAAVRELYINFPDPWPKERHHTRRLINDTFLQLAATRLAPGARLDIATDHDGYAEVIADCLERSPFFCSRLDVPFVTRDGERRPTKYELKALAEGRTCRYFKWQRNETAAPDAFPVPKELPMPHVVLRTPLTLEEIGRRFTPHHLEDGRAHIQYLELFQTMHDRKLLVEAYVKEEPLTQHVGLVIRPRQSGDLVVGLHEIGFPRPTTGIQRAIAGLARWLLSLHSDSTVADNNLPAGFLT